jgi:phage regulator Rha-like protein
MEKAQGGDMTTSNQLVSITKNEPTTTSLVIAEGIGRKHEAIIKTIRRYESDLSDFGFLGFEIQKKRGTQGAATEYAILNEEQTTFLFTLLRNSPIIIEFKKRLVKEFFNLRRRINTAKVRRQNLDWQEQRNQRLGKGCDESFLVKR